MRHPTLGREVIISLMIVATAMSSSANSQTPPRMPTAIGGSTQMRPLSSGCPGGNGIHISVNSGTGSDSSSGLNVAIDERRSIDTTIVFNVARKSWTRTNLAAAISAGLADQSRGGYMICAGVTALMPSATLTINGARGRVHFAATLQDLLNSIRLGPGGTTPQLRRM